MGRILILLLFVAALAPIDSRSADNDETDARVDELAGRIDKVLAENFHAANHDLPDEKKFELKQRISDVGYLRRCYLILLGRNPSIEEARAFLGLEIEPKPGAEKPKPDRRRLVRELTESPEFARQEFRRWVARLKLDPNSGHPAQSWLLTQLEAGRPLDEWTVEWFGKYTVPFLAPTAPGGSEVDFLKTATWMEAFVGKDLSCAACHDHPFDDYYQKDFIKLSGFFNNQGAVRIPENYPYTNSNSGDPVPAATFFGNPRLETNSDNRRFAEKIGPEPWPDVGSSRLFGEWLVKPGSVVFDLNIIDRGWKRVFGVTILDRIDGMSNTQGRPEGERLIDRLVEVLHEVEHDYGRFLRVLMASRIAHLESVPHEPNWTAWTKWALTGPVTRELNVDERNRSLTILETGETEPELEEPMDSRAFRPEAAWLTSADLERRVTGNPLAAIWDEIEKSESDDEALDRVFLATLARQLEEEELAKVLESLGEETEPRSDRMTRALWALLIGEEFAWVP